MPTVSGVERFTIDDALDTPAAGWTAELTDLSLILAPDEDLLYNLPAGLLNIADAEVLVVQIQNGTILTRRLVGGPSERRVFIRGIDAVGTLFKTQVANRYVPLPAAPIVIPPVEEDDSVDVKLGVWTADAMAADLLTDTGLSLFWGVRTWTLHETFDAVGTVYDCLRRLVEPWDQPEPFGVDIWVVGNAVHITQRSPTVTATETLTVAEARLTDLTLGDRQRLALYGRIKLEGRQEFQGGFVPSPGDPVVPDSSLQTIPFSVPTFDVSTGNIISLYEGSRTYRMPDKLLVATVERRHERPKYAGGMLIQVNEETTTTTYEPSQYGPTGPINQPLPQSAVRSIKTRITNPTPPPGITEPSTILGETEREDITWTYDAFRFLVSKTTVKRKRELVDTTPVFKERERLTETFIDLHNGWIEVTTTRTTLDSDGHVVGSANVAHQDAAGYRPGGVRPPSPFSQDPETASMGLRPVTYSDVISTDPTAVPVRYSNPNLILADLIAIRDQYAAASGLYEYPLLGEGPAMPWLTKNAVIQLTGYTAADGTTPIPLDPARIRRVSYDYEDSARRSAFVGRFEAVFYRET